MIDKQLIDWLLAGDVSIGYQTARDLLGEDHQELRGRIETEGWGEALLSKRQARGHWGLSYYQPKWTSSHYTLLDLRNLCIRRDHELIRASVDLILEKEKGADGGINPSRSIDESDVCINGMMLDVACYFGARQDLLESIVDFILSQPMADGGFNCRLNRYGAVHSSLHTTLCILEGIEEYRRRGYIYRLDELKLAAGSAADFVLRHRLFLSDRTGEVINKEFLKFPSPPRWRYNILRALDYFRYSEIAWDERMRPAVDVLLKKRKKDGRWNQASRLPGRVHLEFEKAGSPGRWNTLRALRVLKFYGFL